jgi:hypothetical protein
MLVLMKKLVFSRRDKWFYGAAIVTLFVGVALFLSGHERLGESLSVSAFSCGIAFGIGREHIAVLGRYEHSDQKDEHPD